MPTSSFIPGGRARSTRAACRRRRSPSLRPGLIYVSVSCYGYDGPWATRAGYDPLGQVVSGLAVGEGSLDRPVLASTFTLNDYLAGYLGAAGVDGGAAAPRRSRRQLSCQGLADLVLDVVAGPRQSASRRRGRAACGASGRCPLLCRTN